MPNKDELERKGIYYLRPSVRWFAQRMEKRLREKDKEKGKGWHDGSVKYYMAKAIECLFFIAESRENKDIEDIKSKDVLTLIEKCIDAGNYLMMVDDNLRDELTRRQLNGNNRAS